MRTRSAAVLLCLGLLALAFYALADGTMPSDAPRRVFVGVALLCISVGAVWLAADLFVK
jgi:hypothetical protein